MLNFDNEKMKTTLNNRIPLFVWPIPVLAALACLAGIFSSAPDMIQSVETVRGTTVMLYGRGIYRHMSADVAIQGIAQDIVTLLFAIPAFLAGIRYHLKGCLSGTLILTGVTAYFMVTYFFYLCMGTFNELFLVYVLLTGCSLYGFLDFYSQLLRKEGNLSFGDKKPTGAAGVFLIVNAAMITLLWLSVVVPPLISGRIYPESLQHYTTLIVQGLDLSVLLPASALAGVWLIKKDPRGRVLGPVYLVFLSLLMTALTAKVLKMTLNGVSAGPALGLIPALNLIAVYFSWKLIRMHSTPPSLSDPAKRPSENSIAIY